MSFWNFLGRLAISDSGETIQKVSDTTSISSNGTVYTKMGSTTIGSDGSTFTQIGDFSSDGSIRMVSSSTGLGAIFNEPNNEMNPGISGRAEHRFGFDDDDYDEN